MSIPSKGKSELRERLEAPQLLVAPGVYDALSAMLPHLLCINLNGMRADGPKILPLGQGENDAEILQWVAEQLPGGGTWLAPFLLRP